MNDAKSAVTGQTIFMIHICCGWRSSSIAMMAAHAKPAESDASARRCSQPGTISTLRDEPERIGTPYLDVFV